MQDNDLPQIGTPMQTDETRVEVIQADRDAVATAMCSKARNVAIERIAGKIRRGELDSNTWVQSHARHRAAFAAPPAVERGISVVDAFDMGRAWRSMLTGQTLEDSRAVGRTLYCDLFEPITPAIAAEVERQGFNSFENSDAGICAAIKIIHAALSSPTLHPSDREAIALVVEQAQFLCDRLGDLDWCDLDRTANDFNGHVDPALSRLKSTLAILALSGSLAPANPAEEGEL